MGTTREGFIQEVRTYLRDFKELNRLISGEESSSRMIGYAVDLAVEEFNTTPPLMAYNIGNFPSRVVLLQLTIIHLLTSVGILHSRNRFSYSDGGFSVDTETQDERYQRWIQILRTQVNPLLQRIKVALNIQGGWGAGVESEYAWVHGWYGYS